MSHGGLNDFIAGLTTADIDELVLRAVHGDSVARSEAEGVLTVMAQRGDARLSAVQRSWESLAAEQVKARRSKPPDGPLCCTIRDSIEVEFETRLELRSGGVLVLEPGTVRCSVGVEVFPLADAEHDASDEVGLTLAVSDRLGRVYAGTRRWRANPLVRAALAGCSWTDAESGQLVARGVRIFDDSRQNVAALAFLKGAAVPFAYRLKYFYALSDVYTRQGPPGQADRLMFHVRSTLSSGLPYGPTPPVGVALDELASKVLHPPPVLAQYSTSPMVFETTSDEAEPQATVRLEAAHDA